jgi:tetratricopeptide (TPR) repeat protein
VKEISNLRFFVFFAILTQAYSALVEGVVRDPKGAPVASATIHIETNATEDILSTKSATNGSYRLASLKKGSYTLRATMTNFGEAVYGPFDLAQDEKRKVDLTLKQAPPISFFDEPNFIVAGVSNYSYVGGHGSEPVKRSNEALVRSTASLSKDGPALAEAYEKAGNPLEAVREYQRAAEADPNETNLFEWGTELLNHGALDAANEVFSIGIRLHPRSSRMRIASAVSFYAKADYTNAQRLFFEASDVNPADPEPYLFLGKLESKEITESAGYVERLARFVKLQPENAFANYYYGAALWATRNVQAIPWLEKAIALAPNLAAAHLQLGVIHSDQGALQAAILSYRQALKADPRSAQAHYRLAQVYRQTGQDVEANSEFEAFEKISKSTTEKLDRERSDLKQFVVTLKPKK